MMKSLALAAVPVILMAGCTRPVIKETSTIVQPVPVAQPAPTTVIERQAPPVIVERTAPPAAIVTVPTSPRSCAVGNSMYSHYNYACIDGAFHLCNDGRWDRTSSRC